MATKEAPKPLTKAAWDKIGSDAGKLQTQLVALAEGIQTEGITPAVSRDIAYQVGMIRYAARNLEKLVDSAASAAKQRGRKKA
jgi:hypothetical protein